MNFITYSKFKELKEYIICIYNINDELCITVDKEYLKNKKYKYKIEKKSNLSNRIIIETKQKLEDGNGKIKIIAYIDKEEAKQYEK